MVHFVQILSAVALASISNAAPLLPRDDSAIGGEIPVSAPNGIPMSDPITTATASEAMMTATAGEAMMTSGSMETTSAVESSSTPCTSSWATTTSSAWSPPPTYAPPPPSYQMPSYGSGSQSWNSGSSYNDCVAQCAASFPPPSGTWTPSSTGSSSEGSKGGNGVTHTVIVAPTQGVLRYVPFATNASVGDTVEFHWNASPHTVTQSSALEVCNHTSNGFISGSQNKGFVFSQVVNDTKPIWFYCGTPGHCQKGMFGGINIATGVPGASAPPPSSGSESASSSTMSMEGGMGMESGMNMSMSNYVALQDVMTDLKMNSSDMLATYQYAMGQIGDNAFAQNWGMKTNVYGMSQDAMMQVAENVLYNQMVIAKNPSSVQNQVFSVSNVDSMTIPADFSANLAAASSDGYGSPVQNAASGSASMSPTASAAAASQSNAAFGLSSSKMTVATVALVGAFFAL